MTTTGSTIECSAKRKSACGSLSSTDVSSTYVRRAVSSCDTALVAAALRVDCGCAVRVVTIDPRSGLFPGVRQVDQNHESRSYRPTRSGTVPDDLTVRLRHHTPGTQPVCRMLRIG